MHGPPHKAVSIRIFATNRVNHARGPALPARNMQMDRPPLPPFTAETAAQKARMAEDAWNTRDPARVVLAYTEDSR